MGRPCEHANKFNWPKRVNKLAKTPRDQMTRKAKITKSKTLYSDWKQQWHYTWLNTLTDIGRQPLATLLTVMVITISLTLSILCYLV